MRGHKLKVISIRFVFFNFNAENLMNVYSIIQEHIMLKKKVKKKKRKKITLSLVFRWFLITLGSIVVIAAIIARIYHLVHFH